MILELLAARLAERNAMNCTNPTDYQCGRRDELLDVIAATKRITDESCKKELERDMFGEGEEPLTDNQYRRGAGRQRRANAPLQRRRTSRRSREHPAASQRRASVGRG